MAPENDQDRVEYLTDEDVMETFPVERQFNGSKGSPTHLNYFHHEILRLALVGWKYSQIAEHLGVSKDVVSRCMASPKAKHLMLLMTRNRSNEAIDIRKQMEENLPSVHNVWYEGIMDEDTPVATRLKEAREYMGVCGYVKPQHIQAQTINAYLTMDEIVELKKRAQQRAIESGILPEIGIERVGPIESGGDSVDAEWSESESDGFEENDHGSV